MALSNVNQLTKERYDEIRWDVMRYFEEESGEPALEPYVDTNDKKLVTIGAGFNIEEVRGNLEAVLEAMGVYEESAPSYQIYVDEIEDKLQESGWDKDNEDTLRQELNEIMSDWSQEEGSTVRSEFKFNDSSEVKDAFNNIIGTYENDFNNRLGSHAPGDSWERLALLSLEYAGILDDSENLKEAIENDDRTRAWFEIRYASNLNKEAGVAKRRFAEAAMFGLYEDPTNVTESEAQSVIDFLTAASPYADAYDGDLTVLQHMARYEMDVSGGDPLWQYAEDNSINAMDDYDLSQYGEERLTSQIAFQDIFKPIAGYLIDEFDGEDESIVNQIDGLSFDINGEVVLGLEVENDNVIQSLAVRDGEQATEDNNDLLVNLFDAAKTLVGGKGGDVLISSATGDTPAGLGLR